MTDTRSIEVFLTWGEGPSAAVLAAAFVGEGARFAIGESPDCDVFVPMPRADVIAWEGIPRIVPPAGAHVRVDGRDTPPEPRDLADGEVVEVTFPGPSPSFVIRARMVESETFARGGHVSREGLACHVASFVVHVAILLAFAAQPPPPQDDFQVQRVVMQRLLAASDARDLVTPPTPTNVRSAPDAYARGPIDAKPSPRPQPDAPTRSREAPKESGPGRAGRAATIREAQSFGIVGFINPRDAYAPGESPWNTRVLLDTDGDRVREMFGTPIGDSAGGLSLSGTGLGGGGKGAGIAIAGVGTLSRSTQERLDASSKNGDDGGFAHVHDTRGRIEPSGAPPPIQPIPRPVLERVVQASGGRFRVCHAIGRRRNPTLAGRVDVAFTIGASGGVIDARDAGGKLDDESVRACVVRTFLGLAFPPPMGGVPQKAVLPIDLR